MFVKPFFTASPQLFHRFEDAEEAGLEAGKNFVDDGFKKARPDPPEPTRASWITVARQPKREQR